MKETNVNAKEMKEATIIVKLVETTSKDGNKQTFPSFKYVDSEHGGKLVDLRFKRDVNVNLFAGMYKFTAKFGYWQVSNAYEYPRIYASELDETSIVKIK